MYITSKKRNYPSDRRSTRWQGVRTPHTSATKTLKPAKRPRDLHKEGHVLSITSERECHRVDMKNAAFVKMRDSVSFCKQILIEYVLRKPEKRVAWFIYFSTVVCAQFSHV
ncbi:hypothetical protein GALMADRAFT_722201, partial [Galerina marginata CBS 339.88]